MDFKKLNIVIFFFILFFPNQGFPQNQKKIDSLLYTVQTAGNDTIKIAALNSLSNEYSTCNLEKAMQYSKEGLSLALKINNKRKLSACYLNVGFIYRKQGNYPLALEYYQKSLRMDEELGNKKDIVTCYNHIGILQAEQENYSNSLDYFLKAMKLLDDLSKNCRKNKDIVSFKESMANCLLNLGNMKYKLGDLDSTLVYYNKSLALNEELGDKKNMAKCYNNIGNIYYLKNNFQAARYYFIKTLKMNTELGNKYGESMVLGNISELNIKLKNYDKAFLYAFKSIETAKELGALNLQELAYGHLADAYDSIGNTKEALKYYKLYTLIKDSMFNVEKQKQLTEMEKKYQSEKKQKEIELKESQLAKKDIEVKQQRTQKLAFIGGFVLMLVLSVVIFKSYRDKKKANILLEKQKHEIEEKNEELNQQNTEIAAQRDEIEAQRDLVTKQKEEIELIHEELKDSIYYAERIQKAVLPDLKDILSPKSQDSSSKTQDPLEFGTWNLELEIFVLFKPKDIVSGDFYWIARRNNWLLIAVADCTGHGVPGAFMSMLGISFLNEIIAKDEIQTASHVLDELREYVIHSLQQKGISGEQKDGMDMAFVAIDLNPQTTQTSQVSPGAEPSKTCEVCVTFTAQFAGANNPVYIVETGYVPSLREIRPDKMPVAIHENMQPFTNHVIQLQKGDTIYLMSDGYSDQFGGPKGKKFYEKQLKEMLLVNGLMSMREQKEILDKSIENWKNGYGEKYEQTDDITILALKV